MEEIDLSKTVAVVLAGVQGSRRFELTRAECKPALRNATFADFGHDVVLLVVSQGVAAVWGWLLARCRHPVGPAAKLAGFSAGEDHFLRPDVLTSLHGAASPRQGSVEEAETALPPNGIWRAARLDASVLMPGARLSPDARLRNVVVAPGAPVPMGLSIGHDPEEDSRWFRISGDTTL